jgi:hypothetical protein
LVILLWLELLLGCLLWLARECLSLRSLRLSLLLFLLAPSLFLLPPLSLCSVIQQKCKRAGQGKDNEGLNNFGVDIIIVIIIAARHGIIVVIWFKVIPAGDLGF